MIWKILGSLLLLKCGLSLLQFLWTMCRLYLLPKFGLKVDLIKLGDWGVVTGATDGIGRAIAEQLAKRGLNLVLISRTEEKLQKTAKEIEAYGVEVKTIQFDFGESDGYRKIKDILDQLNIAVLVNNVGVCYDYPEYFLDCSQDFFDRMVNVNIVSMLKMTRIVLRNMTERRKGLIIHIASVSSVIQFPLLTVYAASKSMVNSFARTLNVEYKHLGVVSQSVIPCFVASNMSKMQPCASIPSSHAYAKQCVDAFGLSDQMAGFWFHQLILYLVEMLPSSFVANYTFSKLRAFRTKLLKLPLVATAMRESLPRRF